MIFRGRLPYCARVSCGRNHFCRDGIMEIVHFIAQNTTLFVIIAGLLIALAGFFFRKLAMLSIVCIIAASMIVYVLLYRTSPIPLGAPQESGAVIEK